MTSKEVQALIRGGWTPRFVEHQQAEAARIGCPVADLVGADAAIEVRELAKRWGLTRDTAYRALYGRQ